MAVRFRSLLTLGNASLKPFLGLNASYPPKPKLQQTQKPEAIHVPSPPKGEVGGKAEREF